MKLRFALLLLLIVSCIGCDQATKQVAVSHFKFAGRISFFADTCRIEYAENTGGFLGFARTLSPQARFFIFCILNMLILLYIAWYLYTRRHLDSTIKLVSLALILAGGIGNQLDRFLNGFVIDFLNIGIGSLRTGIFNVADVAIMAGILTLAFLLYVEPKREQHVP